MLNTERLRLLRAEKGITQAKIASLIGVERTTYVRYENGDIQPPIDIVTIIAGIYGVTTDYLLGLSESRENAAASTAPPADEHVEELVALYGETKEYLDEDDLDDIKTIMRLKAERKKARRDAEHEGKGT